MDGNLQVLVQPQRYHLEDRLIPVLVLGAMDVMSAQYCGEL